MINYRTYKNLIRKHAWRLSKKYNYDFDELYSEGCLIFTQTIKKYNEQKAKFSTYLYKSLYFGLRDYIKKNKTQNESYEHYFDEHNLDIAKIQTIMKGELYSKDLMQDVLDFYDCAAQELSENAQQVLRWMIEASEWKRPTYNSVRRFFYHRLGWKHGMIKQSWNEIKKWWAGYNLTSSIY